MNEDSVGPINVPEIRRFLVKDEGGFVTTSASSLSMPNIESHFKNGLHERGGGLYPRIRASSERVTKNAIRPEGSTPVRGSGLRKFGPPRGFGRSEADYEAGEAGQIKKRAEAIRTDQSSNVAALKEVMFANDDERLRCIADCEMHQLKTGGGYDNTTPTDYYETIWNFIRRAETLPELDDDTRQAIIEACVSFRDHLIKCGFRLNSLQPTPFVKVRVDQAQLSNDGTMGWPIMKKSMMKFTEDEAKAINACYGVDLSDMVGSEIDDGYGYVGPCRCADAVAKLISVYNYSPENMYPIYVLFQRIQRHGYKDETCQEPKNGKARAIYVPDVVWGGGLGAMVMDAWQRELERLHVPDFPSLMAPDDQKATISKMVNLAASAGYIVLSADESGYDQSLLSDVMATIMENCVKPFFREEYHPMVDVATMSLVYKVLVTDEAEFSRVPKGEDASILNRPNFVGHGSKWILFNVQRGGLVSGHKGTMAMGSMYGRVVLQKAASKLLGFQVPDELLDGVMAGDDNCMLVLRDLIDTSSEEAAYAKISEVYARFGIEVNPNKQLWVYYKDYPVVQFLQKIYHPYLDINGVGSACRCLQQVDFSEYSPTKLNTAEQAMAQISVMENGWDNPFIETCLERWLASDPRLLNLFQTLGLQAWDALIAQAHMDDPDKIQSILNLESKGAMKLLRSAEDVSQDIKLHIVPLIVNAAERVPPSRERWVYQEGSGQSEQSAPDESIDVDEVYDETDE
jgi:hypothetical protein